MTQNDACLMRHEEELPSGVILGRRPKPMPRTGPSEASEHMRVATALRRAGVCFLHVPLGGARGRGSGAAAARMGASKGFPDFLIFDWPPAGIEAWLARERWAKRGIDPRVRLQSPVGVALELKRTVRGARPTKDQLQWLADLIERGWRARVEWGADEAFRVLRGLGYEV